MTTTHVTPNCPKYLSYLEELIHYQNHKMCMKAKRRNRETVMHYHHELYRYY
jgi:hypothetical protein